jgi:hypothetical protein
MMAIVFVERVPEDDGIVVMITECLLCSLAALRTFYRVSGRVAHSRRFLA